MSETTPEMSFVSDLERHKLPQGGETLKSFKIHLLLEASQHTFCTENELTGAFNIAQQFCTLITQTGHDQEVTYINLGKASI